MLVKLTLDISKLQITLEEFIEQLEAEGFKIKKHLEAEMLLIIEKEVSMFTMLKFRIRDIVDSIKQIRPKWTALWDRFDLRLKAFRIRKKARINMFFIKFFGKIRKKPKRLYKRLVKKLKFWKKKKIEQ